MCVSVLFISFLLCAIRINHGAEPQSLSSLRISAAASHLQQVLPMALGSKMTLFTFTNLTDAAGGPCNGTCEASNTRHIERIDAENCKVDLDNGTPEINVIIGTAVSDSFIGKWRCTLRTHSVSAPGSMSIQSAEFRVFVTNTGWNPELTTAPSIEVSSVSVIVPNSGTVNVTLEGKETLELNITGQFRDYLDPNNCEMICRIDLPEPAKLNRESLKSHFCGIRSTHTTATLKLTPESDGLWKCTVKLKEGKQQKEEKQLKEGKQLTSTQNHPISFTLNISAKKIWLDDKLIIAIAVSTIVLLIIIGQTICIIHFKKKAKRAQIDKNLTPNNTINEGSSTDRYVKKKTGKEESVKVELDEGIYEALEPARDEPPAPPSLATLPVTPKPQPLIRSASQSNLLAGAMCSTTPRQPRTHQNPGRFNTVARSSSLERIKNRPPQPLPPEPDIYEDVIPEDVSPMMKHKLHGLKSLLAGPSTGLNRPVPGKPLPGFPSRPVFLKQPGSNVARPPIASKFPAAARAMGGVPMMPLTSGPGGIPMGGMPLLPSMISAAKLKPVDTSKLRLPPPVSGRPRHPQALTAPTTANPYKPKPPVPLPERVRQEPEPIPEDFESVESDDSDDEFKCYDVLPDYNIYENGAY